MLNHTKLVLLLHSGISKISSLAIIGLDTWVMSFFIEINEIKEFFEKKIRSLFMLRTNNSTVGSCLLLSRKLSDFTGSNGGFVGSR